MRNNEYRLPGLCRARFDPTGFRQRGQAHFSDINGEGERPKPVLGRAFQIPRMEKPEPAGLILRNDEGEPFLNEHTGDPIVVPNKKAFQKLVDDGVIQQHMFTLANRNLIQSLPDE
ncbi:hypothetical protein HY570_03555 [Candidatus Micrarchaeota archaeon]|nr:hypothetical protein [Candidatus Micrarchaeota archaeon]